MITRANSSAQGRLKGRLALVALPLLMLVAGARPAQARFLTWTVSGSAGYGYEYHPLHGTQATNVMLTGGLGFVRDYVRLELGVLGGYGALRTHGPQNVKLELRPMLRVTPPLVPLYARAIFAGLSPFDRTRTIAYGGAVGLNIQLMRVGLFAEVGTLPRRVDRRTHWVAEARAGMSVRL